MKSPVLAAAVVVMAVLWGTAVAQPLPADPQAVADAQRDRIRTERNLVDNTFVEGERDCYQKFAVNDCIAHARVARRDGLADLRRQELSINASEARRKAAQQISKSGEKVSPQAMRDLEQRLLEAQAGQQARMKSIDERAAARALASGEAPERVRERQERIDARDRALKERAAMEQAQSGNRRLFEQKQLEAQKRLEESKKRQQEQVRKAAPTPVKPASGAP